MSPRTTRIAGWARSRQLWIASFVVCGLFIAEDPGIVAARVWLGTTSAHPLATDVLLAAAMVTYNYLASRYVVGVAAASDITEAMERVDRSRARSVAATSNTAVRAVRRTLTALNPFNLVRWAGGTLGRGAEGVSGRVRRRRVASIVGDLGAVNVMGVPGAGLATVTSGRTLSRAQSLRHCLLFVGSWFAGAHLVGAFVGLTHTVPGLGTAAAAVTRTIGSVFTTITDPTRLAGACCIGAVAVSVVRYAAEVQRELATHSPEPA